MPTMDQYAAHFADERQHWLTEAARFEKMLTASEKRVADLEAALRDLVMLERTQAPDMGGKRRTWAFMQTGAVLAQCLDNARALLDRPAK